MTGPPDSAAWPAETDRSSGSLRWCVTRISGGWTVRAGALRRAAASVSSVSSAASVAARVAALPFSSSARPIRVAAHDDDRRTIEAEWPRIAVSGAANANGDAVSPTPTPAERHGVPRVVARGECGARRVVRAASEGVRLGIRHRAERVGDARRDAEVSEGDDVGGTDVELLRAFEDPGIDDGCVEHA